MWMSESEKGRAPTILWLCDKRAFEGMTIISYDDEITSHETEKNETSDDATRKCKMHFLFFAELFLFRVWYAW